MDDIVLLLESFVAGKDRSVEWAKMVEAAIDDFGVDEDPRFEELREHLASYRPGGGEYLFGENEMLAACREALRRIAV